MIANIRRLLSKLQAVLNFEGWSSYPQFSQTKGLGRVALQSGILCFILGTHLVLFVQLSYSKIENPKSTLLWQWCGYTVMLSIFHLLEFFTTAIFNPSQATADSFLVNHSLAYTAAFLGSLSEFWLRYWLFSSFNVSSTTAVVGLWMAGLSQALRTGAMMTAGESFNHYIQTTRKENHALVTTSVYRYLRHPSYVGFFYWSIGLQLLLGNRIFALISALVSWNFFKRRIAYEEESLCRLFPDEYPAYVARSFTGIPFLLTKIKHNESRKNE